MNAKKYEEEIACNRHDARFASHAWRLTSLWTVDRNDEAGPDEAGKLRPRKPGAFEPDNSTAEGATTDAEFRSSSTSVPADSINNSHDQEIKTPPALPNYMTSS